LRVALCCRGVTPRARAATKPSPTSKRRSAATSPACGSMGNQSPPHTREQSIDALILWFADNQPSAWRSTRRIRGANWSSGTARLASLTHEGLLPETFGAAADSSIHKHGHEANNIQTSNRGSGPLMTGEDKKHTPTQCSKCHYQPADQTAVCSFGVSNHDGFL